MRLARLGHPVRLVDLVLPQLPVRQELLIRYLLLEHQQNPGCQQLPEVLVVLVLPQLLVRQELLIRC